MSANGANETAATVRNALSQNIVTDIAARVGYLVSRFFIPPFILARMSLEAYGLWSTAFILVSYIGISTLGISNVNIKYVAEYAAKREPRKANELLSTGLMITLPLCLLVFGLTWLFWTQLVVWLNVSPELRDDARVVVLAVVAIFLSSIAFSLFRDALVGIQAGAVTQKIWVAAYVLETILIFTLVGMGRGVRGLAEAFLLRTLLEISLSAIFAFRHIRWLRISWRYCTREAVSTLFGFGAVVQVTSLFAIVLSSIERAIAAPLVGLEASGLLDIGKKLPGMAASIPSAFASSLLPAASYLQGGTGEEGQAAIAKLYLKGARYMNLSTAYFCAFLACLPLPLLSAWLGRSFPGAALLMTVFSVATQFHLLTGPGTSMLKGLGQPKKEFHYCIPNAVALLIAVPLSWLPTRSWNATSLGVAVACATLVSAFWFYWHADRALFVPHSAFLKRVLLAGMAPYPVAALCSLPAWWLLGSVSRWVLFGVIGVTGLVYSALTVLVVYRFVFDEGERLWFVAVIRSRLGRLAPG
ncbi:MAG: polysaccharide biosynthesis C-terminal domain-containing protein [Bryobacterales bacterium]|nr:polysaccharide biosynthesis C-terminal domain-containing protein [Bryobacterales bacterium]